MAETIAGGAYLATNGETWIDAEGRPLTKEQIAEAKKLHAEQQRQREADTLALLEAQARNDPLARSLAHALRPQQAAAQRPALTDEERRARTEAAAVANEEEHRADMAARKGVKA